MSARSRRNISTVLAIFFLVGILAFGNHKIITSYIGYLDAVRQDQKAVADSIDSYFEVNKNISKEKVKEYMKFAMERDLDIAYIRPWFYFNIIIYNLFLLTAVLGRVKSKMLRKASKN